MVGCCNGLWKGKKGVVSSIVLLLLNVIFICCSARLFANLENDYESRMRGLEGALVARDDLMYFLSVPANAPSNGSSFPYHSLGHTPWREWQWTALKELHQQRCFRLSSAQAQDNLWNFWSSLDFSATVLTTVGYGSMAPRTTAGRIFCVAYSILGVLLMAVYLALVSRVLLTILTLVTSPLAALLCKLRSSARLAGMFSLLAVLFGLGVWAAVWVAVLQAGHPADSLVKCLYFIVVTTATVGLGDVSLVDATPAVLGKVILLFCVGLTLVVAVVVAVLDAARPPPPPSADIGGREEPGAGVQVNLENETQL